jgi:purine-binding chemotaxis protein CheW
MQQETTRHTDQFLTFGISGSEFAIPIVKVREIIQTEGLTRVPHVSACIRGVINLRGGVVPVIDLGIKFGLGERGVSTSSCTVIVDAVNEGQRGVMGILADSVREVVALAPEDIEAPPEFGTAVKVEYLSGLGKLGNGFALILDIDRVLSHTELLGEAAGDPVPGGAHQQTHQDQPVGAREPSLGSDAH